MLVIKYQYLPLINGLKKAIKNNEIPIKDIISSWQNLRNQIENDLYSFNKMYNDETIDFCKKNIFTLIDYEIRKSEKSLQTQPLKNPDLK